MNCICLKMRLENECCHGKRPQVWDTNLNRNKCHKKGFSAKIVTFLSLSLISILRQGNSYHFDFLFFNKKNIGVQSWRAAHLPTLEIRYIKKVILHACVICSLQNYICGLQFPRHIIENSWFCNHDIKLDLNGVVTGKRTLPPKSLYFLLVFFFWNTFYPDEWMECSVYHTCK